MVLFTTRRAEIGKLGLRAIALQDISAETCFAALIDSRAL